MCAALRASGHCRFSSMAQIALLAAVRQAIAPAPWARAIALAAACAAAVGLAGIGDQRAYGGCWCISRCADALGAADGSIVTDKACSSAVCNTAFAAAAGLVGGLGQRRQRGDEDHGCASDGGQHRSHGLGRTLSQHCFAFFHACLRFLCCLNPALICYICQAQPYA